MKIAFCGTVSVGKTTLVRELSKSPEFRGYKIFKERSKYLRDLGIPLNTESTYKGQIIFMAERASELINEDFISDRTVIDVLAFSQTSKEINRDIKKMRTLEDICDTLVKEYDIIFYIPINIPLEDNGVRTTDQEYRIEIDNIIKKIFDDCNIENKYKISEIPLKDRVKEVIEIVKGVETKYKQNINKT